MKNVLSDMLFHLGVACNDFFDDERGETNIIAIILIILVVIGLVGIFSTQMEGIVGGLFDRIRELLNL